MFELLNKIAVQSGNRPLRELIEEQIILVDVRTACEFESGSMAGSLNIPLDILEKDADQLTYNQSIIVFCRSGVRSAQAKEILEKKGFQNVINGGSWQKVRDLLNTFIAG
jgi:phage shock protein E